MNAKAPKPPRPTIETLQADIAHLIAKNKSLRECVEHLTRNRWEWEATARRLASEAGHENSDFLEPDEID